jgi:hypothetical protein
VHVVPHLHRQNLAAAGREVRTGEQRITPVVARTDEEDDIGSGHLSALGLEQTQTAIA